MIHSAKSPPNQEPTCILGHTHNAASKAQAAAAHTDGNIVLLHTADDSRAPRRTGTRRQGLLVVVFCGDGGVGMGKPSMRAIRLSLLFCWILPLRNCVRRLSRT